MMLILISFLFAFAYRIRGGGFIKFRNSTIGRIIWTIIFGVTAILFLLPLPWWIGALLAPFIYASACMPHGFWHDLGSDMAPNNSWMTFYFPKYTPIEWNALNDLQRFSYDSLQCMAAQAFVSLTAFLPFVFAGYNIIPAVFYIAIGSYAAYFLGYLTPVTFPSLRRNSSEWGEFYTGIIWAFALYTL